MWILGDDGRVTLLSHRAEQPTLRIVSLVDGSVSAIPIPDGCAAHSVGWAPRGALYVACEAESNAGFPLYHVVPGRGGATLLLRRPGLSIYQPLLSPDGRQVLFTGGLVNEDLYMLEAPAEEAEEPPSE